MATDKQIAANRANCKRSTGPKTPAGQLKSSRNAFRHGLSLPLSADPQTQANIQAVAGGVTGDRAPPHHPTGAMELDKAHIELGSPSAPPPQEASPFQFSYKAADPPLRSH